MYDYKNEVAKEMLVEKSNLIEALEVEKMENKRNYTKEQIHFAIYQEIGNENQVSEKQEELNCAKEQYEAREVEIEQTIAQLEKEITILIKMTK